MAKHVYAMRVALLCVGPFQSPKCEVIRAVYQMHHMSRIHHRHTRSRIKRSATSTFCKCTPILREESDNPLMRSDRNTNFRIDLYVKAATTIGTRCYAQQYAPLSNALACFGNWLHNFHTSTRLYMDRHHQE